MTRNKWRVVDVALKLMFVGDFQLNCYLCGL